MSPTGHILKIGGNLEYILKNKIIDFLNKKDNWKVEMTIIIYI